MLSRLALTRYAGFAIEIEDFALVTHRVPAERVRIHLADKFELETHAADRDEWCFVSATCFRNRNFRPAAAFFPRHTFYESTYRTYIRHRGEGGVYFFGRYLSTGLSHALQRTVSRDVWPAEFEVTMTKTESGYDSYRCRASSRSGTTAFALSATRPPVARPPFSSAEDYTQFLTHRPLGCYALPLAGDGRARVEHERLRPWEGGITEARFDLWEQLEIVPRDEAATPYSVFVSPGTRFFLHLPVPAL